jgi:hypothetical protein
MLSLPIHPKPKALGLFAKKFQFIFGKNFPHFGKIKIEKKIGKRTCF